MRKLFFICLAVVATLPSLAQLSKKERRDERKQRINALIKQEEEGVIAYHKHNAFGFKLTSDGYGGFFEVGRARSIKKALLFQLDISERKHGKEDKQTNPSIPTSPFIFGKINYFYPVKIGVQQQILLGNKTNRNGVSVTGNFGGGISLALLRPYNLEINDLAKGRRKLLRYESTDSTLITESPVSYQADSVLFTNSITLIRALQASGTGLGKGWGQIKVTPGLYAKAALRFDYGKYNEMLNAIEVGLTGELYSKKIPQLVYTPPKQYFISAYVSVMFGRRK
ncbi:MAG: hypothetical protein H7Z13_06410 [Ferruginibacter sp.]|nr:hypothetical protein [Ferruginibacter sp.]